MRTIKGLLIIGVLSVLLGGCGHEHVFKDATCTEPRTCIECGKTEGKPAGHLWNDATCKEPKTCKICGATEGDLADHAWIDADCVNPKTCSVCGLTEGNALGHSVGVGLCKKCNQLVNEQLILDINNAFSSWDKQHEYASSFVNTALDSRTLYGQYINCDTAIKYLKNGKTYIDNIILLCGDYKELASLKSQVKISRDTMPTSVSESSSSVRSFYDNYSNYLLGKAEAAKKFADFLTKCCQ